MTREEIVKKYNEILSVIEIYGVDKLKETIEIEIEKDIIQIHDLTIASSIIAVFDMLEKKEKK